MPATLLSSGAAISSVQKKGLLEKSISWSELAIALGEITLYDVSRSKKTRVSSETSSLLCDVASGRKSWFSSAEVTKPLLNERREMSKSVSETVNQLRALPAVSLALTLLKSKLPANLQYHSYNHTEDVLYEVVQLALLDALSERETELLAVAAAWHDVGFIHTRTANEPFAAREMRSAVSVLGRYSDEELRTIEQMILDTALVPDGATFTQRASIPLSRYLLDADLANFGRADFFEKSELQRAESGEALDSFRLKTQALVSNHSWLTKAARTLWQEQKEKNLIVLMKSA